MLAWLAGRPFQGRIRVAAGETRRIRWAELRAAPTGFTAGKGGDARSGWLGSGLALSAAVGPQRGIADEVDALPSLRLGLASASATGAALRLRLGTARGDDFRESSVLAFAGYRLGWQGSRWRAWAGLDLGGGAIAQDIDTTRRRWTGVAAAGPSTGIALRVGGPLAIALEGEAPLAVMRRNGAAALVWLPAAWLGAVIDL